MPSTFSTSLKLELPQNGEQSGIWGQTLNNDLILLESAIAGITDLYLTGDATLTSYNGLPDEARNAVISCTGVLSSPANVIAPAVQKTYIITNNTGANVTIKTATGNGVTVLNTTSTLVYCDGTDFYQAVSLNNVTGNQTISGNEVIGANVTATGNLTVTSNVSSYNGNLTLYSNTSVITAAVNTGGYVPPTGTTAQRPSSPTGGMSRFNTDSGVYEIFNGTIWQPITGAYTVTFLLVAGGGAGGYGPFTFGGGGGGGGMLANVSSVQPGTAYTITIGAGGSSAGSSGANTTAFSNTAVGGGGGSNGSTGLSGGSGGGGDPYNNGGSGTSGQGFAGTRGAVINDGQTAIGGGGGGAGAAGGGTLGYAADGGAGNASSITGSSVYYAGGGGGAGQGSGTIARGGFGGTGGGGAGAGGVSGGSPTAAVAGTANKGGGGGAGGSDAGGSAGGGSGVAIISYPSATQRATGGNVTTYTSGGTTYWVHTFNSSGTFTA